MNERQSTLLHSISNRFLRFIGRFREKTYGRVCCRYFGLGDDRLYFHPPPSPRCAHATKEGRVGFTLARRRPTFRIRRKLADGRLSSAPPPPPFSTSKLSRKSSSPLSMDKEKRMRESRDKLRMLGLTSELLLLEHFFFFFWYKKRPNLDDR